MLALCAAVAVKEVEAWLSRERAAAKLRHKEEAAMAAARKPRPSSRSKYSADYARFDRDLDDTDSVRAGW